MLNKMNHHRFSINKENDTIVLDWNKNQNWLLNHILWNIVNEKNDDKKRLVGYLNCFIKFCDLYHNVDKEYNMSEEDILCCLRVSLLHESAEVKAAGIRCIRYFIKTKEYANLFYKLNLDFLIARTIDICLDNKAERLQVLRLIRKLILISCDNFSETLTRCLIAIIKDCYTKDNKDTVSRVCLAYLSELILLNPELCYKCGVFDSLMDNICRNNHSYVILESVIGSYLYLINNPELRVYAEGGIDLDKFIGVFLDYPYFSWLPQNNNKQLDKEDIENRLRTSKNVLISLFRSWPGLIYLCQIKKDDSLLKKNNHTFQFFNNQQQNTCQVKNLNGVKSLIELMYLPFDETRKHLMEIIFELFYLPLPEWTNDFEKALFSTINSRNKDNWNLYNGFVSSEAKFVLPSKLKSRLNFTDNYISLLLFCFISNGILNGLVSIIIESENINNSVRATILLGELLYLSNQYLPPQISQLYYSLPQLMNACISNDSTFKQKNVANAAMSCLNKMHILKKKPFIEYSLNLDLLAQFSNPSYRSSFYEYISSRWKVRDLYYKVKENEETSILNAIRKSQVISRDSNDWDWSLIGFLLKVPSDYMKKIEGPTQKYFIQKLIIFFKPSSKKFSSIDVNDVKSKEISLVGLYFIDFLLEDNEDKLNSYIDDFLMDLKLCLSENTSLQNRVLGSCKMFKTLSSVYFLYIGKLSSTNKGRNLLKKTGIYECLIQILDLENITYTKLIVSSLDYNQEGFSRSLLNQVLISKSNSARYYATNFLRVLLRTDLRDFNEWVIKLLVQQLNDTHAPVSFTAFDILDEACDNQNNLLTLISLNPLFLHLNDKGILLYAKFASCKEGFTYLQKNNLLSFQLNKWKSYFYLKYVYLVEDILNETFTYHQKNEEGTYGRRWDKKHFMIKKDAFIPIHLYGELALCKEGIDFLSKEKILSNLIDEIKLLINYDDSIILNEKCSFFDLKDYKDLTILKLKGALWACSHIASTSLGIELVKKTQFIELIIEIVSSCQFLGIRATCFYCLGLISKTEIGSNLLKKYGWISIKHSREEKWPLTKELINNNELFSLKNLPSTDFNSSVSSLNENLTNFQNTFSVPKTKSFEKDDQDSSSFKQIETFKETDAQISKSLSFINNKINVPSIEIKLEENENYSNEQNSNILSKNLNKFLNCRPRSSSDCQQKLNFNLDEKINIDEKKLHDEYHLLEFVQNSEIYGKNNFLIKDGLNTHITSQNSLSASNENSLATNFHEEKFQPFSDIDESTYEDILSLSKNSKNQLNYFKLQKYNNQPRRKISEPTGSMFFKTYHSMLTKQVITKNVYCDQLKQIKLKNTKKHFDFVDQEDNRNKLKSYRGSRLAFSLESTFLPKNISLITPQKKSNTNSFPSDVNYLNNSFKASNEFFFLDDDFELLETSIPTTEDTIGYATLNALEHKKDKSSNILLFNNQYNGFKEIFLQNTKNSLNPTTEFTFNKNYQFNKISKLSFRKEDKTCDSDFYMSICLPQDLSMMFNLECDGNELKDKKLRNSKHSSLQKITFLPKSTEAHLGFSLHTKEKCLLFKSHSNELIETQSLQRDAYCKLRKISTAENNLDDGDKVSIRKEIIRLVSKLSFSINTHRIEDSLLSLKQKYPSMFQDICLYSEVCLHIANFNFLLQSRRFLQELFLDANFELLFKESREVFSQLEPIYFEDNSVNETKKEKLNNTVLS